MTIQKLKELFDNGILKNSEGDIVILDKSQIALMTDKDYRFYMKLDDAIFELFEMLDIPIDGA